MHLMFVLLSVSINPHYINVAVMSGFVLVRC